MWTKILTYIIDEDNRIFILLGLLVASVAFGLYQYDAKKQAEYEVTKQKNNIEAMTDVVTFYQNLAGEETAQKLAFQTDVEQLKTLNEDLYNELQKEEDKVNQLTKVNAELKADTTRADTTYQSRVGIDQWRFNWSVDKSGQGWNKELEGYTHFFIDSTGVPYNSTTLITKDRLVLQLITGIKDTNGKKRIFVRSSYPNLTVTNIQGAILEEERLIEKPSRFGIGFNIGAGYVPTYGITPTISAGINVNLINLKLW